MTEDQYTELNRKLDAILERLRWSTESCAEWYAKQNQLGRNQSQQLDWDRVL